MTEFVDVPDEIKIHIASFLNTTDGMHLLMTCRSLCDLISNNPQCWQGWQPITVRTNWHGPNNPDSYHEDHVQQRHALANAARDYNWKKVHAILSEEPEWVNAARVGGTAGYSPLHQAAHGNAPLSVVRYMVYGLGAWRTLRTMDGLRAVDIAIQRNCPPATIAMLQPPEGILENRAAVSMQNRLHELMQSRSRNLLRDAQYRLPQVAVLSELALVSSDSKLWCSIPGMYGGFSVQLKTTDDGTSKIVAASWCRVVGGSGQRHEITADTCRMVEEGFV